MNISWTNEGNLLVEYEGQTMLFVNFYQEFHDSPEEITPLQKLELLQKIVEQALNNSDLTV